jgi:hypothetical protein
MALGWGWASQEGEFAGSRLHPVGIIRSAHPFRFSFFQLEIIPSTKNVLPITFRVSAQEISGHCFWRIVSFKKKAIAAKHNQMIRREIAQPFSRVANSKQAQRKLQNCGLNGKQTESDVMRI